MPTLTVTATLQFGDTTPDGAVPCRLPLTYTLTYTEKSEKIVQVAAGVTDESITFDSISSPKFLFARSVEGDVDIKLDDGVTADPSPSALAEGDGWLMLANSNGQAINEVLVTTPASPATGARIEFIVFE